MACNKCETSFTGTQSVVASINQVGTTAYLYVQNQGRNIVMIRRILLCYTDPGGMGILFLRPPPDPITWIYPSAFLETGLTALYYKFTAAPRWMVQAQVEYVEIDGRSRSCTAQF